MPGLVPGIHVLRATWIDVDGRDEPGHDAVRALTTASRERGAYRADGGRCHLPIVMALQVALSQLDWPGLIKFAIILIVAIPPMLASYHLLVRFSFIGVVLNGRRAEKPVLPHGGIATA